MVGNGFGVQLLPPRSSSHLVAPDDVAGLALIRPGAELELPVRHWGSRLQTGGTGRVYRLAPDRTRFEGLLFEETSPRNAVA